MNNQNKNSDKRLRSGERHVRNTLDKVEFFHKWRYNEACKYITKEDVVYDFCMGVGFGTFIISKIAKNVVGIDDSIDAVNYAKRHWQNKNIQFINDNVLNIKEKCDISVAFEAIEHIKDEREFINNLKENTRKYIIISVPHISVSLRRSKWHFRHYTKEMLNERFVDNNWKLEKYEEPIFGTGSKACFAVYKRILK